MAYAIRHEGKVVGLSTSRERAEAYVKEASERPDGKALAIDDEPMEVETPRYMSEPYEYRDIEANPSLLNVITYRVGDELRECCVRDYPWFAAAHAMVRRTKELAGTLAPEQFEDEVDYYCTRDDLDTVSYRQYVGRLHACGVTLEARPERFIESIATFSTSALRNGDAFRFLPLPPAVDSVLEVVTAKDLDVIAGLLLQPLLSIDSDPDIPRYELARFLGIPRDAPLPETKRRLSSVTLDDLRGHPKETMESIRSAKGVYDYHVAYFGDSREFLLSPYDLGECWERITDRFDAAQDDVDRVACVIALVRLFPGLRIPSIICADAVDAFASGDMEEAVGRVRGALR